MRHPVFSAIRLRSQFQTRIIQLMRIGFLTTGLSREQRLLVVAHVYRVGSIRIIMARDASSKERKQYESEE